MGPKFLFFSQTGTEVDFHRRSDVALKWTLPSTERFTLVFPRVVSRFQIGEESCFSDDSRTLPLNVTSSSFVFCSPNQALHLKSLTVFGSVSVLQPSVQRWKEHEIENQLSNSSIASFQEIGVVMIRLTRWLDDLIDRYDFERRLNSRSPQGCSFFVEKQILNEVIRLLCPNEVPTTGEPLGEAKNQELGKILSWIEENIFQEIDTRIIAAKMKLSISQVNTTFQRELGCTPIAYISDLRLEYAARLLERGEFSPSDLAYMCGFSELSAFSRAFKRKFGVSPSDYI